MYALETNKPETVTKFMEPGIQARSNTALL